MQLKENKTTTKLTKQDLRTIVRGKLAGINQHNILSYRNIFHKFLNGR
ncbi:hypothetical protein [Ligilactobacillus agilis]|nr:hypothetical protein [Ligilactobacillus agilis]GET16975.1 hypothetical protein NB11A_12660 [Ligilactobacillus agilis]